MRDQFYRQPWSRSRWLGKKLGRLLLLQPGAGRTIALLFAGAVLSSLSGGAATLVELNGADFVGGGGPLFGTSFYGRDRVNYVYAEPAGAASLMAATFVLTAAPVTNQYLVLEAMDDDAASVCGIRITVNGREIFKGPSGYPDGRWMSGQYRLPADALHAGTNVFAIANIERSGSSGVPPWFMVARAGIGDAAYRPPAVGTGGQLQVVLPASAREFPEPLPPGRPSPGFAFRGTKGWGWTAEQYLAEVPFLARVKMNFLMNCYLSLFSSPPPNPWKNEWWLPLPDGTKADYAQVIEACRGAGINFCFALNPQLGSSRPLVETNLADIDGLYQHYAWAQSQGVCWFSICLDDVSWTGRAAQHAFLVNNIFQRLRANDSGAQMIFCPGPYWGDGQGGAERAYLETLATTLHPDAYVFWTGNEVAGKHITFQAAQSYKNLVRHRLFLWENYPVNDGAATLHLGPITGRDTNLCEIIEGYMGNAMYPQNEINRLPLATCADYAYNPWSYDPARSIGQAILLQAETDPQRNALRDLVEIYPGFLIAGGNTGMNPARDRYLTLDSSAAQVWKSTVGDVADRLAAGFPDRFADALRTVTNDVAWMAATAGTLPVSAGSADGRQIALAFTNHLDASTATNAVNYRLVGGQILNVRFLPPPDTNVLLLNASGLDAPSFFALYATGIKDIKGKADNFQATGPVQDFTCRNIGEVAPPESAAAALGPARWVVYAGGNDIFGANDGFHFVYRPVSGDFDQVLRIRHVGRKNEWSRGGLMVRESVEPGARNVLVGTYPEGTAQWVASWRPAPGDATAFALAPRSVTFPPAAWVRLSRHGSDFLAYYSTNGFSGGWALLASNRFELPGRVLVGMASCAVDQAGGGQAQARFEYSDLLDYDPDRPALKISRDHGRLAIRWPAQSDPAFGLQESPSLEPGARWTRVEEDPRLSGSNLEVQVAPQPNPSFFRLFR